MESRWSKPARRSLTACALLAVFLCIAGCEGGGGEADRDGGGGSTPLFVADPLNNRVLRYDGQTGAFLNVFVSQNSGGLNDPTGLVFGPDGQLYVSSAGTNAILRYDGQTGAFLNAFVSPGSGGLKTPAGLVFFP